MLPADHMQDVLDCAPEALLISDSDGRVTFANRLMCELFGFKGHEFLGVPLARLLPDWAGSPRTEEEIRAVHRDGTGFAVRVRLKRFEAGGDALIIATLREVVDRSELEAELRAAREAAVRADQAKSRFLATASHDMRQPLQALSLLNGTLRRLCHEPTLSELLLQQEQSISSMSRLVNALLDIGRLESGATQPDLEDFALGSLFEDLRGDFAHIAAEKGLSLEVEPSPARVHCDRALLRQVLSNLIANGIKYTRCGRVLLRCLRTTEHVQIEVLDTGIGIPTELVPRIFDEFFQVADATGGTRQGYGLGLAIVNRIVKLLELTLDVSSVPGKGSSFCLEVPTAVQSETIVTAPVCAAEISRPRRRPQASHVLLVEDDAGVRDATRLLLMAEGYRVATAASYDEALSRFDAQPDIDLLITDYHLADSTGIDVITALRARREPKLSAILVSGDTSSRVQGLGHDEWLRIVKKPIQAEQFIAVINELLERTESLPEACADCA